MSNDTITIEVDGKPLQARKGQMLIEVTDAADVYIPRFCYHKKLSVAANCRMCLVEVEKAPKPLPACATPVSDGMKVWTRSKLAAEAQRGTMEFLLINHPLDCPICDQGGECELQDLAMGYGRDISRYTERKRVVKDKNIGPLVQTDMTRCIHCTRCVRFGEEIAGLRELGATGRGEHMEIGTYVEHAMTSELSGNVIDLCPVGALTSKPYRYSARAWEMRARDGIAPHDAIGSNISMHVKGNRVKRVVPRENERINETWIADRDRYAYEGLYSEDRLSTPLIKENGSWREIDWERALQFAVAGLREVLSAHGPGRVGALAAPTATLEELYLLQRLMRGIGSQNIDHRLRQADFRGQEQAPLFPWLGQSIAELEQVDAALLIGAYTRHEHPIANHRLRKAAMRGAQIMVLNPLDYEFNMHITEKVIAGPARMVSQLAAVAKALGEDLEGGLAAVEVTSDHDNIAQRLRGAAENSTILLGPQAAAHGDYAVLQALAARIAGATGARLGYLPAAANECGAWLAGAVPHRGPAGEAVAAAGADARQMLGEGLDAYVLLGVEPELDAAAGGSALAALNKARFVVSLSAYRTEAMDAYADVLLPIGLFAETSGTYVNAEGQWQSFAGAVAAAGETRPAWKVLRVLGNLFELDGFNYVSSEEVRDELRALLGDIRPDNTGAAGMAAEPVLQGAEGVQRITVVPMYSGDPLVRRAAALQQTPHVPDGAAHVNAAMSRSLGVAAGGRVRVRQGEASCEMPLVEDERVPDGCLLIHGAQPACAALGPWSGPVVLEKA